MRGPSHSGAAIWFGDRSVIKSATGETAARLAQQAKKMRSWERPPLVTRVRVPGVELRSATSTTVELEIERVHGAGLMLACPMWEQHLDVLIEYVAATLRAATPSDVHEAVSHKAAVTIAQSEALHGTSDALRRAASLLRDCPRSPLPTGVCHGDLTLCNVLCDCETAPGAIALIDMINPFIDSPVLDVVKMRQDTAHRWVRLFNPEVSGERLRACDTRIKQAFGYRGWWNDCYVPLTVLNFVRLLPYTARGRVADWVIAELESLV